MICHRNRNAPASRKQGRYLPGAIDFSLDDVAPMLRAANPEQLPIMGLPFWYLLLADKEPANRCLDAALILQAAYGLFGIEAVPAPAELSVPLPAVGSPSTALRSRESKAIS